MCISLVGKLADSYQIVQKSLKSAIVKNAPCFSAQIDIYGVPDNVLKIMVGKQLWPWSILSTRRLLSTFLYCIIMKFGCLQKYCKRKSL